ncbi:hypothetical protein TTRE_0000100701 [Trichuris trichiura]|uniref:Uncharacterized protein n=1 Tax=Trichuris trichiura TaxID=36087 RepID=A0A077Z287_TRITR|nr:hypothetical protein TTRE_0000100701 [Trichuris trichiura]
MTKLHHTFFALLLVLPLYLCDAHSPSRSGESRPKPGPNQDPHGNHRPQGGPPPPSGLRVPDNRGPKPNDPPPRPPVPQNPNGQPKPPKGSHPDPHGRPPLSVRVGKGPVTAGVTLNL